MMPRKASVSPTLRYEAGEVTVLEVVDAQSTLVQARNAYDDGLSRYRLALAASRRLQEPFNLCGNYPCK